MESWLTVRKADPQHRRAPREAASIEDSPVSPAWERDALGCWSARTDCPRSWPLLVIYQSVQENTKSTEPTLKIPEIAAHTHTHWQSPLVTFSCIRFEPFLTHFNRGCTHVTFLATQHTKLLVARDHGRETHLPTCKRTATEGRAVWSATRLTWFCRPAYARARATLEFEAILLAEKERSALPLNARAPVASKRWERALLIPVSDCARPLSATVHQQLSLPTLYYGLPTLPLTSRH